MFRILFIWLFGALVLSAQNLTLAKVYSDDINVTGWLMSEKLDGIRAYWNGKELLSKSGSTIAAPEWFLKSLPPFEIDGELWSKRGEFERIASIVLDKNPSKEWNAITYNIFEVPDEKLIFAKRIQKFKEWLEKNPNDFLKAIPQISCLGKSHLNSFLHGIESKGGEGVILRKPDALYEKGRSGTYLKVKSFLDMEAKIIGYNKGEGKYRGKVGSLQVMLENGKKFAIGSGLSDRMRENPPPLDSIITFKYKELTKNGIPKFASFLRIRQDYEWKGVE